MPGKQRLIDVADASKQHCRQQLRKTIDVAVNELLEAGWEPQTIAEALLELADDYMDNVIGDNAKTSPSTRLH
ncbi:hypothetical protein [Rhizobium sp. ZPR3]|uniref:Uncharacterized protein n=2 Tax=unclassified Rhizobium TaxID=2613769 RepID=A0AAU7SS22_9HYPH